MLRLIALALLISLLPSLAAAASCAAPVARDDGWPVSEPQAQQLDTELICAIDHELEQRKDADAHGVVVVRNGTIVHEAYFTGADQRWPQRHWEEPFPVTPHDVATKHDIQSITKSVTALLVGIARDRRVIKNVEAPVLSFFPAYADVATAGREKMTLRDLLTMQAGLDWPTKPYLSMARKVDAAADPYRLILEQPMVAEPGRRWRYNNGAVELVGGIVQKATGRRLDDFAREALFDPLGIVDWEWGLMASGDPSASGGLRLTPRDLAKIGQLVLDHGAWHGKQIVSRDWIDEMIKPRVDKRDFSYGYLWWLDRDPKDQSRVDWIRGSGWGGQCLIVIPHLALVVVVTAGVYDFNGSGAQNAACDTVMDKGVLPAVPHG